jgi:CDP-4-dehydro-6-deoxyglucose reductase
VHQAVVNDFDSLAGYQVYACGAPIMIDVAKSAFVGRGLPEDEFFADSFTYSAPSSLETPP